MCKRLHARIPWAHFAFARHRLRVELNFAELIGLSSIGVESSSHDVWREDTKGKVVAGYGEICWMLNGGMREVRTVPAKRSTNWLDRKIITDLVDSSQILEQWANLLFLLTGVMDELIGIYVATNIPLVAQARIYLTLVGMSELHVAW
jgi:hypothetical protein